MTTHSSILAWRSPWTEVPDGLQSMGWQRVRHGWAHNTRHLNHMPFSSQKTAWTTAVSGKFQGKDNSLFCICNKFFVSKKRNYLFYEQKCQFLHILEPLWNTVFKISSWGDPKLLACLEHFLEKAMAPHSSTLAWKIPWMEEPARLQSMGLGRVRHIWETSLSLFTFLHWRRKWQPTPVFLPGESQGRGSLMGCRLWGSTESDTTEAT